MSSEDINVSTIDGPTGTDDDQTPDLLQQAAAEDETHIPESSPAGEAVEAVENLLSFESEETALHVEKNLSMDPTASNDKESTKEVKETKSEPQISTEKQNNVEDVGTIPQLKTEDLGLKSPLAHWMINHNASVSLLKLLYWKELQRSAVVFGSLFFLLLALRTYSLISVFSIFSFSLLAVAALYRIGMTIVNAVQKTSAEHPFKNLLEENIEFSEETAKNVAERLCKFINKEIKCLQKLFLIDDFFQSIKFGVTLWLFSYVGSVFSISTLVILTLVGFFTIPKLYEEKQAEIDQAFQVVYDKFVEVTSQIEAKLPDKIKKYLIKDKKE